MGTEVKHYSSAFPGAPVLTGQAGALLAVLDACLVNGFGLQTLDSLVVADNVATATVTGTVSGQIDTVVTIAGATPAGLNGEWRVFAKGVNWVQFATTGIADQTATGTITMKLAGLGWERPYSGTNKAVYKMPDPLSTGGYLRVDDTGTTNGRAVGYMDMTDIDTGTNPFPSEAQVAGGMYAPKSATANATVRPWVLVGDSRGFYIAAAVGIQTSNYQMSYFGDLRSYLSGDPFACTTAFQVSDIVNTSSSVRDMGYSRRDFVADHYLARMYSGLGGAIAGSHFGGLHGGSSLAYSGAPELGAYNYLAYPNAVDNSLLLCDVFSHSVTSLRGTFPGLSHTPQTAADYFVTRDKVGGSGALAGRTMMAVSCGSPAGSSAGTRGVAFLDITGPWR